MKVACAADTAHEGRPPRRITVDELVGFSQVFGVPVEQLLLPPELVAADELAGLVVAWNQAQDKAISAKQEENEAWERVRAWVERHPEYEEKAAAVLRHWSETYYGSSDSGHEFRAAHEMRKLTRDDKWGARAKETMDALAAECTGRVMACIKKRDNCKWRARYHDDSGKETRAALRAQGGRPAMAGRADCQARVGAARLAAHGPHARRGVV